MILVECNPDEYFISAMGFNSRRIKHQQGRSKVLKGLVKGKGQMAVIDEDPGKGPVSVLEGLDVLEELEDTIFLSMPGEEGYVIVLRPDLETWLLKRARTCSLDPSDFGLPKDPDRLHSMVHVERNSGFREFIEQLIEKDEEACRISNWIRERTL